MKLSGKMKSERIKMRNPITIKQAVIKETTVTVKNIIIGKRQLTQRVFKQIQEEYIVNELTGELKGEAWGYVNYFWKKFPKDNHRHILWINENGELRRCLLPCYGFENKIYEHAYRYLLTKLPQLYIAV